MLGDLFKQCAAKYVGIDHGVSAFNTNQLWASPVEPRWWSVVQAGRGTITLVIVGSLIMIAGAVAIDMAEAPELEQQSGGPPCGANATAIRWMLRALRDAGRKRPAGRRTPVAPLVGCGVAAAIAFFLCGATGSQSQPHRDADLPWMIVLVVASVALLIGCGILPTNGRAADDIKVARPASAPSCIQWRRSCLESRSPARSWFLHRAWSVIRPDRTAEAHLLMVFSIFAISVCPSSWKVSVK
ncbi:MAG: hypothetical protein U0R19_21850 [Bryobacteraceae bacterium]